MVLTLYASTTEQTMQARALRPMADVIVTVTRAGRYALGIGWKRLCESLVECGLMRNVDDGSKDRNT